MVPGAPLTMEQVMADITVKITYQLVEQTQAQKREHMCSGCTFRMLPCMELLFSGAHCGEGTVYIQKEFKWLG